MAHLKAGPFFEKIQKTLIFSDFRIFFSSVFALRDKNKFHVDFRKTPLRIK